MGAVAEQATEALTVGGLWKALKIARRKHRPDRLEVVLLTMHSSDLRDLLIEDRQRTAVNYDFVRNCWTAFGVPITEKQMPGASSHRAIVLKREPMSFGMPPADWRTVTVQDMNRIVTEEF